MHLLRLPHLLLSLLIIHSAEICAQSFLREYELPEDAEIAVVAVAGFTGYYAAGKVGNDGLLMKLNSVGDLEWMYRYQGFTEHPFEPGLLQYEIQLDAVVAVADGAYVHGTAFGYLPEGAQRLDMRVTSEGEVVWMRHIGEEGDQHAYDAGLIASDLMVVGSRETSTAERMWLEIINMGSDSTTGQHFYHFVNDISLSGKFKHFNSTINGWSVAGTPGIVARLSWDLDVVWSHVYDGPGLQDPVGVRSVANGWTGVAWADHFCWYDQSGTLMHSKALDPSSGTIRAMTSRNWAAVLAGNAPDGRVWLSEINDQGVVLFTTMLDEAGGTGVVKDLKLGMGGPMVIGFMRSQPNRFALAVTQTNGSIECGSSVPPPVWTDVPIQSIGQIQSMDTLPPEPEHAMDANSEEMPGMNVVTCVGIPVTVAEIGASASLSMSFHPNPFTDRTMMHCSVPLPADSELRIWDLQGKQVLMMEASGASTLQLPRAGLAPGTYIARLITPMGTIVERLVAE